MFKIDTKQFEGLSEKIATFSEKVHGEIAIAGAARMAVVIYDEVRLNAERGESGLLASAVYRVYSPEKSTGTLKLYRISWNKKKAPHGHLVEFGTSRAPAYPFLRPALSRMSAAVSAGQERMGEKLDEITEVS